MIAIDLATNPGSYPVNYGFMIEPLEFDFTTIYVFVLGVVVKILEQSDLQENGS